MDLSHGVPGARLNTLMKKMGCNFPVPWRHTFAWHDTYCSFVFRNWQSVLLEHCNMVSKHTFLKKRRDSSVHHNVHQETTSVTADVSDIHFFVDDLLIVAHGFVYRALVIYSPRAGTRLQTHWMTLTERYRALLNILVKSRPLYMNIRHTHITGQFITSRSVK